MKIQGSRRSASASEGKSVRATNSDRAFRWSCATEVGLWGETATSRPNASAPGWIRTSDLRIRSPLLYPAELQGLAAKAYPAVGRGRAALAVAEAAAGREALERDAR
jgi:hypothetical protein